MLRHTSHFASATGRGAMVSAFLRGVWSITWTSLLDVATRQLSMLDQLVELDTMICQG